LHVATKKAVLDLHGNAWHYGFAVKNALIIISVIVFTLFVGTNLYWYFYPGSWTAECRRSDDSGRVVSTARAHSLSKHTLELFITASKKRGEVCVKFPDWQRDLGRRP
jgi:hypothetical protein